MTGIPTWTDVEWSSHVDELCVGGRTVQYVDYGSGPPLLLIHGMAGSWHAWLQNIPELGDRHRVIAVDLPGFGGSDSLPRGAGFDGYIRVLRELLDQLGIRSVAVFGHSLGGLVALAFAAEVPHRVRCVVLVSGGGAELSRLRLAAIQGAFWAMKCILSVPGVSRILAHPLVTRALLWPAVHDRRALPLDLVRRIVPQAIAPGFLDAVRLGGGAVREIELREVCAPVLLAWGREDRILPLATGLQLEASLPVAQLFAFDGVGHCAMLEAPKQFNDLAGNFLELQRVDRGLAPTNYASARSWLASRLVPGGRAGLDCDGGLVG